MVVLYQLLPRMLVSLGDGGKQEAIQWMPLMQGKRRRLAEFYGGKTLIFL
jgi:hypothetical protein